MQSDVFQMLFSDQFVLVYAICGMLFYLCVVVGIVLYV